MRRYTLIALFLLVAFGGSVALAHATTTSYPLPKHAKTCREHYRKHVEYKREHGKRVKIIECVLLETKLVTPTPQPATITPAPTVTAPAAAPTVTAVRATIDPDWTLAVTTPQNPPVPVTFTYSASAGSAPLPDGELTLSIFVHASVSSAGGCETNVGGDITTASCTVSLPAFGSYDLVTSYSSGVGDVAATGSTETVDIEPPAPLTQTVIEKWGTTPPTNDVTVNATIIGTTANIIIGGNFLGATSITVTDNYGDTCTATPSPSNTHMLCDMTVTGTPTSFTINYPGTTDTTETQTIAPWGIDQPQTVDYQWPAETITVNDPTVTVQTATVEWAGGYVRNNGVEQTHWTGNPPNPLVITTGEQVELNTVTIGSLASDLDPLGAIDYQTTPDDGTWTAINELVGSADCSATQNYSLIANGYCNITFTADGQYTVQPDYLTNDNAYADTLGPTLTIDVTN